MVGETRLVKLEYDLQHGTDVHRTGTDRTATTRAWLGVRRSEIIRVRQQVETGRAKEVLNLNIIGNIMDIKVSNINRQVDRRVGRGGWGRSGNFVRWKRHHDRHPW